MFLPLAKNHTTTLPIAPPPGVCCCCTSSRFTSFSGSQLHTPPRMYGAMKGRWAAACRQPLRPARQPRGAVGRRLGPASVGCSAHRPAPPPQSWHGPRGGDPRGGDPRGGGRTPRTSAGAEPVCGARQPGGHPGRRRPLPGVRPGPVLSVSKTRTGWFRGLLVPVRCTLRATHFGGTTRFWGWFTRVWPPRCRRQTLE